MCTAGWGLRGSPWCWGWYDGLSALCVGTWVPSSGTLIGPSILLVVFVLPFWWVSPSLPCVWFTMLWPPSGAGSADHCEVWFMFCRISGCRALLVVLPVFAPFGDVRLLDDTGLSLRNAALALHAPVVWLVALQKVQYATCSWHCLLMWPCIPHLLHILSSPATILFCCGNCIYDVLFSVLGLSGQLGTLSLVFGRS